MKTKNIIMGIVFLIKGDLSTVKPGGEMKTR